MKKINRTTYQADTDDNLEVIVGDEKQADFFPRVKLKRWNNEVNFSIGTIEQDGRHSKKRDTIIYKTGDKTARFYAHKAPTAPQFDTSYIRLIKLGAIPPYQIGSIYELNTEIPEPAQTINIHWCDRFAIMYYGYYNAETFLDLDKVGDTPQMRVAMWGIQNQPMIMDETLKLVDIHYNEKRDNLTKINKSIKKAVKNILKPYKINIFDPGIGGKLYFMHRGKKVKFFSGAFIGGHYYFYFNLGIKYNGAHDYYRADVKPSTKDTYAYGLRAVADIPDSVVDQIVIEYARLYGLPIKDIPYSDKEQALIDKLNKIHQQLDWVLYAKRDDVYNPTGEPLNDGFEFEIELSKKPSSNIIPFTIRTKGLIYYYQDELTPEEKIKSLRSPHIVGSYAVYHESKSHNEYTGGKAFHIYRPWAIDKTGNKVWCSFDPEWNGKGNLHITVPQDFIDTAAYPIVIDPTFGYTTATQGGTNIVFDDTILGTLHTSSEAGTIQSLSMYLATNAAANCEYEGALYLSSSGALVEQTDNGTVVAAESWRTVNFASGQFSASTDYYISAWGQGTGGSYGIINIYYDSTSGKTSKQFTKDYAANAWEDPITWGSTDNDRQYSMYITYSVHLTINLTDGTSQVNGPKIV